MEWFEKVLKSPKYIVAPMVDQSELAWRVMARKYGAQLCFTPMINAKLFVENPSYRKESFPEETFDRPLIVQFCANNPSYLLAAAKIVAPKCDAIDLNLGCPQDIARRGHYGSYLQDEWKLISEMISLVAKNLSIPITAKIRIFPNIEKSIQYAKMLEASGASMITVHGRIREQKGHATGLADWKQIKAIKDALSIPIIANGNILYFEDISRCIKETGCDGVMSAEAQLYNPALFSGKFYPAHMLALEYLQICRESLVPSSSIIRGHLFKIFKHILPHYVDLRQELATAHTLEEFKSISMRVGERLGCQGSEITEVQEKPKDTIKQGENLKNSWQEPLNNLPLFLAQPYIRPLPDFSKMPKKKKLLENLTWTYLEN